MKRYTSRLWPLVPLYAISNVFSRSVPISIGEKTWMAGNASNSWGNYGSLSVTLSTNYPGARWGHTMVPDPVSNQILLFGGYGHARTSIGYLNDLWTFDLSSQLWTWISGYNYPNSIGFYGKLQEESVNNMPGARAHHSLVIDSRNRKLHLFGGYGAGSNTVKTGYLNDLWSFNLSSKSWAWLAGSNMIDVDSYRPANSSAYPMSRYAPTFIFNSKRNFLFLFGGYSVICNNCSGQFIPLPSNDLWVFSLNTNKWYYLLGYYDRGGYQYFGIASRENWPNSRYSHASAVDGQNERFFLYGGRGYTSNNDFGFQSDLWMYDMGAWIWTWLNGDETSGTRNQSYVENRVFSSENSPGSRTWCSMTYDTSTDSLILFGGYVDNIGFKEDFWMFSLTNRMWARLGGNDSFLDSGSTNAVRSFTSLSTESNEPDGDFYNFGGVDVNGTKFLNIFARYAVSSVSSVLSTSAATTSNSLPTKRKVRPSERGPNDVYIYIWIAVVCGACGCFSFGFMIGISWNSSGDKTDFQEFYISSTSQTTHDSTSVTVTTMSETQYASETDGATLMVPSESLKINIEESFDD